MSNPLTCFFSGFLFKLPVNNVDSTSSAMASAGLDTFRYFCIYLLKIDIIEAGLNDLKLPTGIKIY